MQLSPGPHSAPHDETSHDETSRDVPADALDPSADGPEDEGEPEFGAQKPTRFAADVEYRGRSDGHDYLVRVRHRLLDTTATVVIDGIEHDPKAEEKARKKAEKAEASGETPEGPAAADAAAPGDGLRFRCEEGFASLRFTVRRPDGDGDHKDAEVIHVRTAGLGGAGEVDVRRSFGRVLLAPDEGSPSAAREAKRTEHPTRYALLAALMKSAQFLIPLLGLGALLGGLLDPLFEWADRKARPAIDAVAAFLIPIRDWVSELTRPVREFVSALLRPVREAVSWLMDLLFGWIPDLSLPFSVPGWVVDVAIPVIVVVLVFLAAFGELRHRRERLEKTRRESAAAARESESGDQGPTKSADEPTSKTAEPARDADEDREDSSSTAPPSPER